MFFSMYAPALEEVAVEQCAEVTRVRVARGVSCNNPVVLQPELHSAPLLQAAGPFGR